MIYIIPVAMFAAWWIIIGLYSLVMRRWDGISDS